MTIETSNYEIIVVSFLQKEKRAEVLSNRGFLIKRAIQREKMGVLKVLPCLPHAILVKIRTPCILGSRNQDLQFFTGFSVSNQFKNIFVFLVLGVMSKECFASNNAVKPVVKTQRIIFLDATSPALHGFCNKVYIPVRQELKLFSQQVQRGFKLEQETAVVVLMYSHFERDIVIPVEQYCNWARGLEEAVKEELLGLCEELLVRLNENLRVLIAENLQEEYEIFAAEKTAAFHVRLVKAIGITEEDDALSSSDSNGSLGNLSNLSIASPVSPSCLRQSSSGCEKTQKRVAHVLPHPAVAALDQEAPGALFHLYRLVRSFEDLRLHQGALPNALQNLLTPICGIAGF